MANNEVLDDDFARPTFEVYRTFYTESDAKHLISVLQSSNIPHQIERPKPLMDAVMGGDPHSPKIFVRVRKEDFKRLNQMVEEDMLQLMTQFEGELDDHFLQEYTDEELMEVLRKPESWSMDVVVVARQLLKKRGLEVSTEAMQRMRAERLEIARQPQKINKQWLIALYLLAPLGALLLFLTLAGYLAVLCISVGMGFYYWTSTTIDADGERFYTFDEAAQQHGKRIVWLSIACHVGAWAALFWWFN